MRLTGPRGVCGYPGNIAVVERERGSVRGLCVTIWISRTDVASGFFFRANDEHPGNDRPQNWGSLSSSNGPRTGGYWTWKWAFTADTATNAIAKVGQVSFMIIESSGTARREFVEVVGGCKKTRDKRIEERETGMYLRSPQYLG